ncbi:acyl-CoA dehydrogenase [Clostridioides difficile]|nr:acyl-CoA dehydrogenase [Clostridioides difficile]
MDFRLTEAQLMLQRVAKEFAENEIAPIAAETDKTGIFPRSFLAKWLK